MRGRCPFPRGAEDISLVTSCAGQESLISLGVFRAQPKHLRRSRYRSNVSSLPPPPPHFLLRLGPRLTVTLDPLAGSCAPVFRTSLLDGSFQPCRSSCNSDLCHHTDSGGSGCLALPGSGFQPRRRAGSGSGAAARYCRGGAAPASTLPPPAFNTGKFGDSVYSDKCFLFPLLIFNVLASTLGTLNGFPLFHGEQFLFHLLCLSPARRTLRERPAPQSSALRVLASRTSKSLPRSESTEPRAICVFLIRGLLGCRQRGLLFFPPHLQLLHSFLVP